MKAVIKREPGQAELVTDRPIPQLRAGYLLVKTMAVGLNPIDWMQVDYFPAPNSLLGHDYAGIVEAVGEGVNRSFCKGDRICGYALGGDHINPENGTFAEYILAKADVQHHIPDHMGYEEAATIGAGILTGNMGLFLKLGLKEPTEETTSPGKGQYLLIYGGSTSSGAIGIQLAARSGYTVLTTCSPRNADFVTSLGAKHVLDYNDPNCAQTIREITKDQLFFVWDTISTPAAAKICTDAMSTSGGRYVTLLPVESPRKDVQAEFMNATQCMGEYQEYGSERTPIEVDPEAYEFTKAHVGVVDALLAERKIKPHQVEVGRGGLSGILDGLQRLRLRQVSARKLVYRVDETP